MKKHIKEEYIVYAFDELLSRINSFNYITKILIGKNDYIPKLIQYLKEECISKIKDIEYFKKSLDYCNSKNEEVCLLNKNLTDKNELLMNELSNFVSSLNEIKNNDKLNNLLIKIICDSKLTPMELHNISGIDLDIINKILKNEKH